MYILPAAKEIYEYAVLMSEPIQTSGSGKCLSFWYYMQGNNAGSLIVQMEVVEKSLTTVWQLDNANHANWFMARVLWNSQQSSSRVRVTELSVGYHPVE